MSDSIYKLVEDEAELSGAYEVWRRVFVAEQGIPEELVFQGEDNPDKLNVVVKDGERVVGTARVMLAGSGAKVERMAVLKSYRQKGIGWGIISFLEKELSSRQVRYVYLRAQHGVVDFYRSCGFRGTGQPFYEAGIRHIRMEMRYSP